MKKLLALLLALCLLTGCQLATEKKNETELNDKLVGVFITFDHMGGEFDLEQWFADHPEALKNGGEIILEPEEGMAYAERIPVLLGDDCWLVPGYEGISVGRYWNGEYWTGFSTEGLCELHSHISGGETEDAIEEEGTVYVPMDAEVMLCSNPVYMTSEGEYYTIPAMGLHGSVSDGGMSQSISDEKTWTEDGVETSYSAKFTTTVKGVTLAQRVVVVQMSADHEELARTEYLPGQAPESMTPEADAAYLIVEEQGEGETLRKLYQPGDPYVTVYYQGEQVWCLPEMMEILWSE